MADEEDPEEDEPDPEIPDDAGSPKSSERIYSDSVTDEDMAESLEEKLSKSQEELRKSENIGLDEKKTSLDELSKDKTPRGKKMYRQCHRRFREIIGKRELKNEELEKQTGDLQQRLNILECSMPAVMVWNIWRMTQGACVPSLKRVMEKQFQGPAAGEVYCPSTPSRHFDCRVREVEAERKQALKRVEEARTLWAEKMATLEDRNKKLEEAKKTQQETKEKIQQLTAEARRLKDSLPKEAEDGSCETGECGVIECKKKWLEKVPSNASIKSTDIECLQKLQELAENELAMKRQIADLERREEAYMRTLQQADELWCKLEGDAASTMSALQEQLDLKTSANQKMADRICQLEDVVEELMGRLSTCRGELEKYMSGSKIDALIGRDYDFAVIQDKEVLARAEWRERMTGTEETDVSDKAQYFKSEMAEKDVMVKAEMGHAQMGIHPDDFAYEDERLNEAADYLARLGSLSELDKCGDDFVCRFSCNDVVLTETGLTEEEMKALEENRVTVRMLMEESGMDVEAELAELQATLDEENEGYFDEVLEKAEERAEPAIGAVKEKEEEAEEGAPKAVEEEKKAVPFVKTEPAEAVDADEEIKAEPAEEFQLVTGIQPDVAIETAPTVMPDEYEVAPIVKTEEVETAEAVTSEEVESIATVKPETVEPVAAVTSEEVEPAAAVTPEKVEPIAAVTPETVESVAAVTPQKVEPVAPVTPETDKPVAEVTTEKVEPVAAIRPETVEPVAAVIPETVESVAAVTPEKVEPVAGVTPKTVEPVAAVTPEKVESVAPVTPETVKPVAEVTTEKVEPVAAIRPETVEPVEAVIPETVESVAAVTPEKVEPVAAVTPETVEPVAAVTPKTVEPVAPVTPETVESVAEVTTEKVEPVAAIRPETVEPLAAVMPETVEPVAAVTPEKVEPVAAVTPEKVEPVAAVTPKTVEPVAAVTPKTVQPVAAVTPETVEPVAAVAAVTPEKVEPVAAVTPETVKPVAAGTPEKVEPVAAVTPETVEPVAAVTPQKVEPAVAVTPETVEPVAAVTPQKVEPVVAVTPETIAPVASVTPETLEPVEDIPVKAAEVEAARGAIITEIADVATEPGEIVADEKKVLVPRVEISSWQDSVDLIRSTITICPDCVVVKKDADALATKLAMYTGRPPGAEFSEAPKGAQAKTRPPDVPDVHAEAEIEETAALPTIVEEGGQSVQPDVAVVEEAESEIQALPIEEATREDEETEVKGEIKEAEEEGGAVPAEGVAPSIGEEDVGVQLLTPEGQAVKETGEEEIMTVQVEKAGEPGEEAVRPVDVTMLPEKVGVKPEEVKDMPDKGEKPLEEMELDLLCSCPEVGPPGPMPLKKIEITQTEITRIETVQVITQTVGDVGTQTVPAPTIFRQTQPPRVVTTTRTLDADSEMLGRIISPRRPQPEQIATASITESSQRLIVSSFQLRAREAPPPSMKRPDDGLRHPEKEIRSVYYGKKPGEIEEGKCNCCQCGKTMCSAFQTSKTKLETQESNAFFKFLSTLPSLKKSGAPSVDQAAQYEAVCPDCKIRKVQESLKSHGALKKSPKKTTRDQEICTCGPQTGKTQMFPKIKRKSDQSCMAKLPKAKPLPKKGDTDHCPCTADVETGIPGVVKKVRCACGELD